MSKLQNDHKLYVKVSNYYRYDNYAVKRKTFRKKNSDIIVIWVSDWFNWVNFMQNLEHDVTVSYMMLQLGSNERQLSVFCCFLFAGFNNC